MEPHKSARPGERTGIPGQGGSELHAAVSRLCQGIDEEASFRFVHDALYGQVRSFFVARGVSVEDVFDLTQDVFVRLFKSRGKIRHPKRIRGLIWIICQNVLRRWLSRRPPAHSHELPEERFVRDDTTPEDIYAQKDLTSRLRTALGSLPPRTALVARMRLVDDLSNTEIAEALGTTKNNVAVLFHDSKVRLRKILEPRREVGGGQGRKAVRGHEQNEGHRPPVEFQNHGGQPPEAPGGSSGGGGPERYLQGQFPETVRLHATAVLEARVTLTPGPSRSPIRDFDVPPEGRDVLLTLQHQGFKARGENHRMLHVPRDGDSDWVAFELESLRPGVHTLELRVYAKSCLLGSLELQTTVERTHRTTSSRERRSRLRGRHGEEGDYTLEIDWNEDQQVYSFRLIGYRTIWEPVHSSRLQQTPRKAVEVLIHQFNRMARGANPYDTDTTRLWLTGHGQQLWEELVPKALQRRFWKYQGDIRRMLIVSKGDLIPWELLYPIPPDGAAAAGFLAEQFPIGRWCYGRPPASRISLRKANLGAPVNASADARREILTIARLLERYGSDVRRLEDVELNALLRLFQSPDWNVLHLACHNAFQQELGSAATISLGREPFQPVFLRNFRRAFRSLAPLVFINACRSSSQAPCYTDLDGWAQAFLETDVGAFVGSLWEVREETAADFAQAFYAALSGGDSMTLGEALMGARLAVRDRAGDPTWLAYTLYGDPGALVKGPDFQDGKKGQSSG